MAPQTPTRRGPPASPPTKKCGGRCGRLLPRSSFSLRAKSKDGLFPLCKECHRDARGPRGREGQQARRLEKELWSLREIFGDVPSLADILNRGLEEVRQLGATGAKFDEQIRTVRRAVEVHGCRTSVETVEETGLSRWVVERALERLVSDRILETRDGFRLDDAAEEPGRPATEYHPVDTPRGEVFTHILRRAVDDDLL